MTSRINLRQFEQDELMFDAEETRIILKFIFRKSQPLVENMTLNDELRGFAQGLLVEAVDASYALGFVEALFRSTTSPGASVKKVFTKFDRRAARHWFKHARPRDLSQIKVYERVRERLEMSFGRVLMMHSQGIAKETEGCGTAMSRDSVCNLARQHIVWG